jgi:hypothetical protein
MASQFAVPPQEEIFDVYGGNDFQYSNFEYNPNNNYERNGRTSVPNYMKPTQSSRRRARSADARPQYRSSSSSNTKSRRVQPTKSFEDRLLDELLQQQFQLDEHDIDVQRLPQQQMQTTYQGPQMQLPTQDGDHFMDPNLDEPTERIHYEREINNPFVGGGAAKAPQQEQQFGHQKEEKVEEFYDPFGGKWNPDDDKRRWDMPYEQSLSTYPTPTNANAATQQQKVQGTMSFPDTSPPTYPTRTNSSQPQKVQGTKSFPSSGGKSFTSAASQKSQTGDWRSTMMKSTMVSTFLSV